MVPYPVVAEVLLPAVERTWYRRRRREPTEIPLPRPGSVYVFRGNGTYAVWDGQHIDYADEVVVTASTVSLVDVRPRQLPVDIVIPSALPNDDFTVRSTFRCRVSSPAAVAEFGLTDLDVVLASHLASDDELGSVGRSYDVSRAHRVRQLADVRVRALCAVAPPDVPGMDLTLVQVEVFVPTEPGPAPRADDPAGPASYLPSGRRP
jgi:hypothetical protein